jgi:hypothetical protein
MKALTRRSLTTDIVAAVTAIPAVGLPVGLRTANAAVPDASEDRLKDLWQRFIAAEVQFAVASSAQDNASSAARQETKALACPWTPLEREGFRYKAVAVSERRRVIEEIKNDVTMLQIEVSPEGQGDGPWLVSEYQPLAADHPFVVFYRDGYPLRWRSYPKAASADEAYDMATTRAAKEWRSFDGKRSAISRKHQVRKFNAGVDAASDACCDVRREIAEAQVTGALALAIKLGVWAYGNDIDLKPSIAGRHAWNLDDIEMASLVSVYKHAVSECGFDPVARARETMRKHYKTHRAA